MTHPLHLIDGQPVTCPTSRTSPTGTPQPIIGCGSSHLTRTNDMWTCDDCCVMFTDDAVRDDRTVKAMPPIARVAATVITDMGCLPVALPTDPPPGSVLVGVTLTDQGVWVAWTGAEIGDYTEAMYEATVQQAEARNLADRYRIMARRCLFVTDDVVFHQTGPDGLPS